MSLKASLSLLIVLVVSLVSNQQAPAAPIAFQLINDDPNFPISPIAIPALQEAGRIWGNLLNLNRPGETISVRARMEPNFGTNAITNVSSWQDAPLGEEVWYPTALAHHLTTFDLGFPQFEINFDPSVNWYFGTDRKPAANQIDFVSVALHEIAHGLGFTTGMQRSNSGEEGEATPGEWMYEYPFVWDTFLQAGSTNFTSLSSLARLIASGGDDIHWDGASGKAAFFGNSPKIAAKSILPPGTRLSHLDGAIHPYSIAGSYGIFAGESLNPKLVELGMLADMGWNVRTASLGDTNGDFVVNETDLLEMQSHYTGPSGSGPNLSLALAGPTLNLLPADLSDTDQDGDVDALDLNVALRNYMLRGDIPGGAALAYNPLTGEVTVKPNGLEIVNFALLAGSQLAPFSAASFTGFPPGYQDNAAEQIGWTAFDLQSGITTDLLLGAILPQGLDEAGFRNYLSLFDFGLATDSAFGGGSFALQLQFEAEAELSAVPEPSSALGTMVLGLLAAWRGRRRPLFKQE